MIRRPDVSVTTPTPAPAATPAATPAPTTTPTPVTGQTGSSDAESDSSSSSSGASAAKESAINYGSTTTPAPSTAPAPSSAAPTPTVSNAKAIDFGESTADVRNEVASILSGITANIEADNSPSLPTTTDPTTFSAPPSVYGNGDFADFENNFTNLGGVGKDPYASSGTVEAGIPTNIPSFARDDSSDFIDTTELKNGVLAKHEDGSVEIVSSKVAKLMGTSTKKAYSDMVDSVLDYARSKGVSNPEALTNAILTNEKLLSQDHITLNQSQDLVSRLPDLVDAFSLDIEAPKYYSPEHLQQLTQDPSVSEDAPIDSIGEISRQEAAQLQQLEKMYEQFAAIKDDPRLEKELGDHIKGFFQNAAEKVKDMGTAVGMVKFIPFATIAVSALESRAARQQTAELSSFQQAGMIENPLANGMTDAMVKSNKKDALTSGVDTGLKATFSGASAFVPGVGEAVSTAASTLANSLGKVALDLFVGEALTSGVERAGTLAARLGSKAALAKGIDNATQSQELSDILKNIMLDPSNDKTNFRDTRVGEAFMSYLSPAANDSMLASDAKTMEDARLSLREDLFGLTADQDVVPISTKEAKDLRQHIDLLLKDESESTPLLDARQYADGIQERWLDPLSMIAGSDKDAQPKQDRKFFRDFRGD